MNARAARAASSGRRAPSASAERAAAQRAAAQRAPAPTDGRAPEAAPARPARPVRASARGATPIAGPRPPRKVRQTIKKVDLWSVLKISLLFYMCEMAVAVAAVASLWIIIDSFGIVSNVEHFVGDLLSTKNFHFLSAGMLRGAILVALVLVALQVVVTVIATAFYNLFAQVFGGIEVTVIQEDAPVKR